MVQEFIHLRLYSAYSLSKGAIKLKKLPDLCKKHNMPAVAITDNNLFGALEFSEICKNSGVQPIIGLNISVYSLISKSLLGQDQKEVFKILLLAQNESGYKNLMKLTSISYLNSSNPENPEVSIDELVKYSDGLIALSGGIDGFLGKPLLNNDWKSACENLFFLKELYKDKLYIEIIRDSNESVVEDGMLKLAFDNNVPIVATNHVYFDSHDMVEAHDALLCISEGTFLSEQNRSKSNMEYYFKSQQEMKELFQDLPEAIENTICIAKRCYFAPSECKPVLPEILTKDGRSVEEELISKARDGLESRVKDLNLTSEELKIYKERLEYELNVILKMKFPSYFLIVADFIKHAHDEGIAVGPGRGSGAGSLVAWCLRITNVNPIFFKLIFERFLNPERVSMPDFDIDFCQERRDEIIKYVCDKYGKKRVAHIIAIGTLQPRAVIRDVGRVMGIPYSVVDKISKLVPNNPNLPLTLQQAIDKDPIFQEMIKSDYQIKKMINIALKLEGLYRHASTHAAGIVISNSDMDTIVPLYKDPKSDIPVTQFNLKMVEKAGLVKFDFLGLKTLTTIQKTCELLKNRDISLDIDKIPLNDAKTFKLIRRLDTAGVFQLESAGMKAAAKLLDPDKFDDIISLISLYRPGPMDDIPKYAARKHKEEEIVYPHPIVKDILEPTYGVMVYQEQVMHIAQVLAGYSLGQADLLRRAMGKKIKSELDSHRKRFVSGAVSHGMQEHAANNFFDQISKFAGYGFNKSHATPYALIAYQTAYLKANYPVEFMTATMNLDRTNVSKLSYFRNELNKMGIKLLPPDIQKSQDLFSVEVVDGELCIRYGLAAIKGTGEQAMKSIYESRKKDGEFKNLTDFILRFDTQVINKKQLESLICSGAFDSIHDNRRELFENVQSMVKFRNNFNFTQTSLFGAETNSLELIKFPNWSLLEKLNKELESIGFYLSNHPLSEYTREISSVGALTFSEIFDLSDKEENITLCGIVLKIVKKISKKGKQFVFIHMSDISGLFEVVAFSEVLNKYRSLLEVGKILVIKSAVKIDGDITRITAIEIEELKYNPNIEKHISIEIFSENHLNNTYKKLQNLKSGDTLVELIINGKKIILPNKYEITDINRQEMLME